MIYFPTSFRKRQPQSDPGLLRDDFAVSRLFRLRKRVGDHPYKFLLIFVPMVLFWTATMSYGVSLHGRNGFAVQYMPHVALYCGALGILIYPMRYSWLPIIVFLAMLSLPLVLPVANAPHWVTILTDYPTEAAVFAVLNIVMSLAIGVLMAVSFNVGRSSLKPYAADMLLVFIAEVLFVSVNLIGLLILVSFADRLSPETRAYLTIDTDFVELAIKRILRGGIVIAVFLQATLTRPRRSDLPYVALTAAVFLLLIIAHSLEVYAYPMMDIAVVALVMTLILPSSIAPVALTIGVAVYAAYTGTFLVDTNPADHSEALLEYFAIAVLQVVIVIISLNAYRDHQDLEKQLSIRRLDAARDFADVGIFVVNIREQMLRLDMTGLRILGVQEELAPFEDVIARIHHEDRPIVLNLRVEDGGQSESHTLRIYRPDGEMRTISIFVWGERAETGATLAYGLVLDVTDQQTQEHELRNTLAALSEKDENQRRMFSIISHEIRTPASVISLLIEDLSEAKDTDAIQTRLREASEQLLSVLSDMRQAVNPEQNLPVTKTPYSPSYLTESVRNTFTSLAEERGMKIVQSLGAGADKLRVGDSVRIKQLVGNLVRNALIHSKGTTVSIGFENEKDENGQPIGYWTVSDDGVGIPPDEVARLFEPFERGNLDPRNQTDGSGLGLYIVKSTVELLGGTIEYLPLEKGAAYRFGIPDPFAAKDQVLPRDTANIVSSFPDKTALFVEDNALVAEVTMSRLEKRFKKVTLARNGREALERVQESAPDVLITDLFMPELEGDELIRILKKQGHRFPMVGLSAAAVGNDMERFVKVGAELILAKPINMKELTAFLADKL